MTDSITLSTNSRLFAVSTGSGDPLLLWASTCPVPECMCRRVTIVAARDPDELKSSLQMVCDALHTSESPDDFEARVGTDALAFELDIDTALPMRVHGSDDETPLADPRLLEVAQQIDGEVLDGFGALWQQGKGESNVEIEGMRAAEIRDWVPGDLVAWQDAFHAVRQDIYLHEDHDFEADELYCVAPDCDCRNVLVEFYEIDDVADPLAGVVEINGDGNAQITAKPNRRRLAEQLWAGFCQRHPRYRARFDARHPKMRLFGELLHAGYAEKHKPRLWVPTSKKKKRRRC